MDLGMSRSIEESQQRGAFVFAYAPDSIILFDSVPVVIKEAFVERHRQYENMESDSIVFWPKWYHTIILFEERKPWHRCHYKVNTRHFFCSDEFKSYYPKDSINWALDNNYSIWGPGRIIYNTKSNLPEDELFIYIEQIHLKDEAYNRDTISRLDIKRDTLGCLHLVRMN